MNSLAHNENFLDRIGLTSKIFWGFVAVMIFMMGDGLEIGWLSPYLIEQGLTMQQSSYLFSAYGIIIALSSWLSGVAIEAFGAKKTMFMGVILYLIGTVVFVGFGVAEMNYTVMIIGYGIRGFGYPLFAFGFLVWIAYRTSTKRLGKAVGWFWFVFTGGMNVLGAYYSIWAIEVLGYVNTLWTAALWVSIAAFFALVVNKDKLESKAKRENISTGNVFSEFIKGIAILKKEPKVGIAGVVRVINQTAQYAFPIFLPTYLATHGIETNVWLGIWGSIFISNIAFNLIFGVVGDKFGWRNTVMWFGGVGCGFFTLLLYYTPQFTDGNVYLTAAAGLAWGACLAAYVPLSALVPSLVKTDKGAAMSILNLGAGLCVFVGPMVVGFTYGFAGAGGVMWILAILYFTGAFMTKFITLPNNAKTLNDKKDSGSEKVANA
ncbi:polyol permease family [Geomicrobium halophilum]|uniref:Polyol permease family n=1 Tax=Geomicrobium halophilum TaxID=549000 RepID=A0A841PRG9_9BACL|nr:MFS transporter [Geomicrobium halophilum]MBB6451390.1 polyol permease family [Geomicrobium halophilum]